MKVDTSVLVSTDTLNAPNDYQMDGVGVIFDKGENRVTGQEPQFFSTSSTW
jgi:hypothetical protein